MMEHQLAPSDLDQPRRRRRIKVCHLNRPAVKLGCGINDLRERSPPIKGAGEQREASFPREAFEPRGEGGLETLGQDLRLR